jgi:hypothetical protein
MARFDKAVDHEAPLGDRALPDFVIALPWRTKAQPFSIKIALTRGV